MLSIRNSHCLHRSRSGREDQSRPADQQQRAPHQWLPTVYRQGRQVARPRLPPQNEGHRAIPAIRFVASQYWMARRQSCRSSASKANRYAPPDSGWTPQSEICGCIGICIVVIQILSSFLPLTSFNFVHGLHNAISGSSLSLKSTTNSEFLIS